MNGAFGRHPYIGVQTPHQQFTDLARPPMGLLLFEPDDLAIEDGSGPTEGCEGFSQLGKAVRPILVVAGHQPGSPILDPGQHAVAVELDLVQPIVSIRRLLFKHGKFHCDALGQCRLADAGGPGEFRL